MTDGAKDEGGRSPDQVKKDLAADSTPRTSATASGLAALGHPKGTQTAVDNESNTGIKPDAVGEGQPPVGQQRDAAFFTANGSIPANSIPSPSGPVPASTIPDEATRNRAIETARAGATSARQGRNGRYRISREAASRLSPAELRAVATDRGYADIQGGRQAVLQRFLDAQEKDKGLEDPPKGHPLSVEPAPVPAPVGGAVATGNPLLTPSAPSPGLTTPAGTLRNTDGSTPTKGL